MKHSVHPFPACGRMPAASAFDENAGMNHSCITARAPASQDSGV
jgi:hypothetical protein